jgi:flagellar basal body-associated protein FliL
MATSSEEAALDKLLEKLGGGASQQKSPQTEPARLVKRTEVATQQHKRSVIKYIIIGIAIIILLAAIVYFVANTSHGKSIQEKIANLLPFGTRKRKIKNLPNQPNQPNQPFNNPTNPNQPTQPLVAKRVDFRTPTQPQKQPRIQIPQAPVERVENSDTKKDIRMDPNAVPIRLQPPPQPQSQNPMQGPRQQQQYRLPQDDKEPNQNSPPPLIPPRPPPPHQQSTQSSGPPRQETP